MESIQTDAEDDDRWSGRSFKFNTASTPYKKNSAIAVATKFANQFCMCETTACCFFPSVTKTAQQHTRIRKLVCNATKTTTRRTSAADEVNLRTNRSDEASFLAFNCTAPPIWVILRGSNYAVSKPKQKLSFFKKKLHLVVTAAHQHSTSCTDTHTREKIFFSMQQTLYFSH